MSQPWIEKYRPVNLSEVIGQDFVIKSLNNLLNNLSEFPHLLLYGKPGTGKTTISYCLANQILDQREMVWAFKELNASDQRRLEDIRELVIPFVKHKVSSVPFKILLLDEVDHMAHQSQPALRRIMEQATVNCRFILTCNEEGKVIEPIQSRCATFRLKPIPSNLVFSRLEHICQLEKVKYDINGLKKLSEFTDGDLRKAIGTLQESVIDNTVSLETVEHIIGKELKIYNLFNLVMSKDLKSISVLNELLEHDGIDSKGLIGYFYKVAVEKMKRYELIPILARYDGQLQTYSSPKIQLNALVYELINFK